MVLGGRQRAKIRYANGGSATKAELKRAMASDPIRCQGPFVTCICNVLKKASNLDKSPLHHAAYPELTVSLNVVGVREVRIVCAGM